MRVKSCLSGRRPPLWLLAAILVLLSTLTWHPASAQTVDDGVVLVAQDWEARHLGGGAAAAERCGARAYHPRLLIGEVLWVFDLDVADRFPNGYLVVDRRLTAPGSEVQVLLQDGRAFPLSRGHDRHAYSRAGDSSALFQAMRADAALTLVLSPPTSEAERLTLSLLGFTRATDAAAEACARPAPP